MLAPVNYCFLHQELCFFVCLQPVKKLHSARLRKQEKEESYWRKCLPLLVDEPGLNDIESSLGLNKTHCHCNSFSAIGTRTSRLHMCVCMCLSTQPQFPTCQ